MRLYLDAAPVIYLIEYVQPFASRVEGIITAAETELIVSDLTRLECRVKPVHDADSVLLGEFDRFFGSTIHEIVFLSAEVMDKATELRAQLGYRTPDAIHVAAALIAKCDVFLTNDHRLDRTPGIAVQII